MQVITTVGLEIAKSLFQSTALMRREGDYPPSAEAPACSAVLSEVRDLIDAHRASSPMWWHSAISYVASLEKAMRTVSKFERRSAEIAFKEFVREMAAWVEGRDPWQQMAQADVEQPSRARIARLLRLALRNWSGAGRYPRRCPDVRKWHVPAE